MSNYFPLSLAAGTAFCNRVNERALLANNIKECRHSLLISPRRYGKTSLAQYVFHENKIIYENFDFLLISDEFAVQEEIMSRIGRLINNLMPLSKKALTVIKKFMVSLRPEITLTTEGAKVKFITTDSPKNTIIDLLISLDKLAGHVKKHAVLFMDEFQQISTIENGNIIEAAIRHAAERAKNICYIFSGSNRHLLIEMFQNSERPLFNLCYEIYLQRISHVDYVKHLKRLANKQWKANINDNIIEKILDLTKRHPYYVNQLCTRVWRLSNKPTLKNINGLWDDFCHEQQRRLNNELANLSPNQRGVIKVLAKNPTKTPTNKIIQQLTRLSSSSLTQSLNVLKNKDLVFVDEDGFTRPLNPMVEYVYA